MSVAAFDTFFSVGAVMLGIIAAAALLLWLAAFAVPAAARWRNAAAQALGGQSLWLGWLVAVAATTGSLYYSLIADRVPCDLCWYQRIAMYPLTVVLLAAAATRDRRVGRYALPLAGTGLLLSGYHYLIQWFPDLEATSCSATTPCTGRWVWEFGFVSIPFMALAGFAAVIAAVLYDRASRQNPVPVERSTT